MANHYYDNREDKLSSGINSPTSGIFEYCESCGAPIILKLREFWEKQNPHNWLLWKKMLVESRWEPFDVDDVNRRHICKERQQQETLEQWTGI